MKKLRNFTLFDNYNSYDRFDEAKECLIENGFPIPSDQAVWSEISDWERMEWEDMLSEVEKIFPAAVITTGTCGTWRGNLPAGKIFFNTSFEKIVCQISKDCDYIKIGTNEYGRLYIKCTHHDGSNHFEFKEITAAGYKYFADWDSYSKRQNLSEQNIHERIWVSSKYSKDICIRG